MPQIRPAVLHARHGKYMQPSTGEKLEKYAPHATDLTARRIHKGGYYYHVLLLHYRETVSGKSREFELELLRKRVDRPSTRPTAAFEDAVADFVAYVQAANPACIFTDRFATGRLVDA